MATKDETDFILLKLGAAYPWVTISDPTADEYWERLKDVPFEWLLRAKNEHVEDSTENSRGEIRGKFFPSIAELRQPYDEWIEKQSRADKERQWKANLEDWKQEALPAGEARKLLTDVIDAAGKRKGTEIVPFRGRGLRRVLSEKHKEYELGASVSEEELEERRRRRAKEGA